ncbi:hypothetical protein QUB75_05060 [Microcoleus sp. K1-B6]|uniref:hypothetical protein n=1 Tax=unclassified Microcoleus TaxID=2642155 RepID=UPI002FD326AC
MTQIQELAKNIVELSEQELILRLGLNAQEFSSDLTRSASIDSIKLSTPIQTRDGEVLLLGESLFRRLNTNSYDLLCKDPFDDGKTLEQLKKALDENIGQAAGMLAPILVANLGLAPAIAAIMAALIVKILAKSVAETICEAWAEALKAQQNQVSDLPT